MKTQVSKIIFSLVLIASMALAVTAVHNNAKKGTLQPNTTMNTNTLAQTNQGNWCKGDIVGNTETCNMFYADCSVCWSQQFIFSCFWMCDSTGSCEGNSCPADNGFCVMNMQLCNTCFIQWQECSCPAGSYTIINADHSQTCEILPCEWGFFKPNPDCTGCEPCNAACIGCSDSTNYCGPNCNYDAGYCNYFGQCVLPEEFQCPTGLFMEMTEDGCFDCVYNCPFSFVANPVTGRCEKCPEGCQYCTSQTDCVAPCELGYCQFQYSNLCLPINTPCPFGFKVQPDDPSECGWCVDECVQCPDGTWCDGFTHTCNPVCGDGFMTYDKQCIPVCEPTVDGLPQFFTIATDYPLTYKCVSCDLCPSNAVCDNFMHTCTPCDSPNWIFEGVCVDKCPAGTYLLYSSTGKPGCWKVCPDGMWADDSSNTCQDCSSNCLLCSGSADSCDPPCPFGYKYFQFQCLRDCPYGYYAFGHTDVNLAICLETESCMCGKCHETCATCNGMSETNCVSCPPGKWATTEGRCVESCPQGTYPREDAPFCQCCHSLCTSCFGPSVNQCLSCVPTAMFDDVNTCYESWEVQSYNSQNQVESGIIQ